MAATDEGIPDEVWWFASYAEAEDFIGIGKKRVRKLARNLQRMGVSHYIINRLLKDNGLPHGPCNMMEWFDPKTGLVPECAVGEEQK